MRVKELITKLQKCNEEAFVEIRDNKRWTEDVYAVTETEYDNSTIVEISSLRGHRFDGKKGI